MRLTEKQYRELYGKSLDYRINKYHNKKIVIDGHEFESLKEGEHYKQLKLLERTGIIKELELQKKFELQPAFTDNNGKKHRAITYIADFYYYETVLKYYVAEDVKGYKTKVYKIKKKMFMYKYPNIVFKEIL